MPASAEQKRRVAVDHVGEPSEELRVLDGHVVHHDRDVPEETDAIDANAKRITKKGTTKERAYAAIALFVAAGLALGACGVRLSEGAPRVNHAAAESGSPALNAESAMSRFQTVIFPESHPSACERSRLSAEGSWHKSKSLPKVCILLVWEAALQRQFCLDCSPPSEQVRLGCGSSAARADPARCPRAAASALRRARIGKQLSDLVSPARPKRTALPQLVKIFLDTQLPHSIFFDYNFLGNECVREGGKKPRGQSKNQRSHQPL